MYILSRLQLSMSRFPLCLQSENEDMSAMACVLVGVEMLQCNRNPRHMEFSVPSLSTVRISLFSYCSRCPDCNNRCQHDPLSPRSLSASHHLSVVSVNEKSTVPTLIIQLY